ncbi:MAG: hypothetical protein HZB19_14890 [Chloroflexi bacterium]|nr:hypothetical protein [Chloroflexota bacterium]
MPLIRDTANQILDADPDPAIRLRLLRDVLHSSPKDPQLIQAKTDLDKSRWVIQLKSEQRQDGSWGRFHSEDTKHRQSIPTTEFGVEHAQALGLDESHPIVDKVINYLARLIEVQIDFPDPPENNDRWPTGTKLFTASTLARIKPEHPALNESLKLWSAIAEKTFSSGMYNPEAEIEAHLQLTGASVKNSYLRLHGKYQIALLSSRPNLLSHKTETSLLNWLWRRDTGMGYLEMPLTPLPRGSSSSQIERWFTSLEIVSRFSGWCERGKDIIQWLWNQHGGDGLWDFGPKASHTTFMPLSENWQKKSTRRFDWTTRTLLLLEKCVAPDKAN